jgi:hypothetical protein
MTTTKRQSQRPSRMFRLTLAACAAGLSFLILLGASAAAQADSYWTGMLSSYSKVQDLDGSTASGGFVYGQDSWAAPAGETFDGFAYTAGAGAEATSFQSVNDESVGGVDAGFGGDGTANSPEYQFPWTQDCSITNNGHYWVRQLGTVAGRNGCSTSGNSSGWNYTNSELVSGNVGLGSGVGANYSTLWLSVFCQAASCNGIDQGEATVNNLSAQVDDPSDQPSETIRYWGNIPAGGTWFQTDSDGPQLDFNALDASGVCYLNVEATGASNFNSGNLVSGPGTTDPGSPIGTEFSNATTTPCNDAENYAWSLPGGIASGTYYFQIQASNAGDYQADGFSGSGSPIIGDIGSPIDVDDVTPSMSWPDVSSGWTSSQATTLDVTAGPSGLSSLTCTDDSQAVTPTLISGSSNSSGTTIWRVPTTVNGQDNVSCAVTNGDANGALRATSATTVEVDDAIPTVSFSDSGYSSGTWTNQAQTVGVNASTGPSGLQSLGCSTAAGPLKLDNGQFTINISGGTSVTCTATSGTHVTGSASFNVDLDPSQPTESFLVNGSPPNSDWLTAAPVVQVIGSEAGGMLSGLSRIVCSVTTNGQADRGSPVVLSTALGNLVNNSGSFTLTTNGADVVSCQGTTVAGTTQAAQAAVTVDLDDPIISADGTATTVYGSSQLIDAGADPYTGGPSQTTWYRTPQSVTITANDTGGSAPITGISCKGALSGSWPASGLNTDPKGGEQITVTVSAPGGALACQASDSAGNNYPLGSYLFQIDDSSPSGQFVARSNWPQANELALKASDNRGSGVAYMHLYAKCGCYDSGAAEDLGDMTYDSRSGLYEALIPDGVAPFTSGSWTFFANDADLAGNQGQITAGPGGDVEQVELPLLDDTKVTASIGRASAALDAAIPAGLAKAAGVDAEAGGKTRAKDLGHSDVLSDHASALASRRSARAAEARPDQLTVRYGHAERIGGMLTNVQLAGQPIDGAKILVYQRVVGQKRYTRLGTARTNLQGRYSYRVKAGASRALYVVYPGTRVMRPAVTQMEERFDGRLTISASAIKAGGRLLVSGVVKGGHIPAGGVAVTIDYRQVGAPGSGTLGTVRTNRSGDYRFSQHFSHATKGLSYEVWAVVPSGQPGWPYVRGRSIPLVRHIL